MIYASVNLTVEDYKSTCDKKIFLYRGDKNVEIRFVIINNPFTVEESTYAQLIIKRPSASSLFSEVAPIQNDIAVLTVSGEMIDELVEIGEYAFQIRLYDNTMTARATLPPCDTCLVIERPLVVENESVVNQARINDSAVQASDTEEDIFTEDGEYIKTEWVDGDLITDTRLNKIENALYTVNGNTIFKTSEPVLNTLGGITAGSDLNGMSIPEVLNKLLYPYLAPVISVSSTPNGGIYEHGNYQTITSIKVIITKKTESIVSLQILDNGAAIYTDNESVYNGGTFNIPCDILINNNRTLLIEVVDASNTKVSARTNSFNYVYPYYTGVADDSVVIDGEFIKTLTKKVETKGEKTISYTTNNNRMIFAYPESYGRLSKILDANSFDVTNTFEVITKNMTMLDGTSQTYYIYSNNSSTVENFAMKFFY